MRKLYWGSFGAGAVAGLFMAAGIATGILPAFALVFPGQYAPRFFPTQQTAYERHVINITAASFQADTAQNICAFSGGTCSIRIGAFPYNAYIVRAYQQITTSCNAATTCTLALGTTSAGVNLVAAESIMGAAGGSTVLTVVAANAGITVTGNNTTSSGANGGFDLFATVTFTGAAPTTGTVVIVVEYFLPNDGGCITNVAMASTAGPC